MKRLKERISEFSAYLQQLTEPQVFLEVQNAVETKDKEGLLRICKKIQVPEIYVAAIVSLLLTIGPQQKWPLEY